MPEELMTADEIRAELDDQSPPRLALDHEEQAAEADIPEPREDRPPRQDPGSQLSPKVLRELSEGREARRELAEIRQQMERLQGALDERITPVQDFVLSQKQKEELARELAEAPEVGTTEHAEWVLQRANRTAVAPIQEKLDQTAQLIEKLASKVEQREQAEKSFVQQQQQHETRIAALNYETSRLTEEQVAARDAFITRRKKEYEDAGADAEQATMSAAFELERIYGQAYDRYQELGHGGETLVHFMRNWGWIEGNGQAPPATRRAAPAPAAPAAVDPDIARRQRHQTAESFPAAAPPAQPASGDASEREFVRSAAEMAKRNPTKFRRELIKRAQRRGISEDEYEQRYLIPDAPE